MCAKSTRIAKPPAQLNLSQASIVRLLRPVSVHIYCYPTI
jgi:hypothetical protein